MPKQKTKKAVKVWITVAYKVSSYMRGSKVFFEVFRKRDDAVSYMETLRVEGFSCSIQCKELVG